MTALSQDRANGQPAAEHAAERRQYRTLDGLRGIAALSIVVLHTPHFFGQWHLPYSFLSVDLFFVLSGFVLAGAYQAKFGAGMSAAGFFRLRLIRLFPLYLLGTLLGVPVALMAMKFGGSGLSVEWSSGLFALSLPMSLLMLPTPTAGADGFLYPFNPVLWTIFFELAVNMVYAVLARSLADIRKLSLLVLGSAVILVFVASRLETLDAGATWFTFLGGVSRMMFSFFCGVLVFRLRQPVKLHSSLLALGLLAVLVALLAAPHSNVSALATILLLFPVLVLAASCVEPGPELQRTFAWLGVTSYAVYAVHKPLYQILLGFLIIASPVKPQLMAPWIGIGYLFLVFAGSMLIDRFYDMPVRQFLGGLRSRRPDSNLAK